MRICFMHLVIKCFINQELYLQILNILVLVQLVHLGQYFGIRVMKQFLLGEGQERNTPDAPCLEESFWI